MTKIVHHVKITHTNLGILGTIDDKSKNIKKNTSTTRSRTSKLPYGNPRYVMWGCLVGE
jgi:hypothetical protein